MGTEADWIEGWVAEWGDRLLQFVASYVRNPAEAEDIVQETFVRLYLWHQGHPGRPITAGWLYTTAWHRTVDYLRGRRRQVPDWPRDLGAAARPEEQWVDRMVVEEVLDKLKEPDRMCLLLFYYAGLSTAEIARQLGIKEPAVRARLMRARRRFEAGLRGGR